MKNIIVLSIFLIICIWSDKVKPFTNLDVIAFILIATFVIINKIEEIKEK